MHNDYITLKHSKQQVFYSYSWQLAALIVFADKFLQEKCLSVHIT